MKVTFANFGPELASSRLRAIIPQATLERMGVEQGKDVLVYGKHILSFDQIKGFGKYVFDICDDHFGHPDLGQYYRDHADHADLITCNSEVMQRRILEETGRDSIVIPEPYECAEMKPDIGSMTYWFGHRSNAPDLMRIKDQVRNLYILTNPEWTMERHEKIMSKPLIVVLPTGKSMAKSENRMVESIRRGRYVCAEYLPAYEPFYAFFPCRDIPEHIDYAMQHERESLIKIQAAQDYIRDRYSPVTIAMKWLEAINGIN